MFILLIQLTEVLIVFVRTSNDFTSKMTIAKFKRRIYEFPSEAEKLFKKKRFSKIHQNFYSDIYSNDFETTAHLLNCDESLNVGFPNHNKSDSDNTQSNIPSTNFHESPDFNVENDDHEMYDSEISNELQFNLINQSYNTDNKHYIDTILEQYQIQPDFLETNADLNDARVQFINYQHDKKNLNSTVEDTFKRTKTIFKENEKTYIIFSKLMDIAKSNENESVNSDYFEDFEQKHNALSMNEQKNHKKIKKNPCTRTINRKNLKDIQISIWKKNSDFIEKMGSLASSHQIQSFKDDLSTLCSNYLIFILNEIESTKYKLLKDNFNDKKIYRQKKITELIQGNFFCPFCSTHKLNDENFDEIEQKFKNDFPFMTIRVNLIGKINELFEQISKFTIEPFTPENLFKSDFSLQQRKILKEILAFFDSRRIHFSPENRKKYLHIEYHKFFKENISMKLHFLQNYNP